MAVVRGYQGRDPNYDFLCILGSGSFGRVWKVQRKRDGKILACKSIDVSGANRRRLSEIRREMNILKSLDGCRFCIQWDRDVAIDTMKQRVHLHMRFCNYGNLDDLIRSRRQISEKEILEIFWQLVQGLTDFHHRNILHRDIKPNNILRHRYAAGEYIPDLKRAYPHPVKTVYFADFGQGKFSQSARNGNETNGSRDHVAHRHYQAPESTTNRPHHSQKTDIFSLGCTMWELCEGRRAYTSKYKTSVPELRSGRSYSQGLKSLIRDCMAIDPHRRLDTRALGRRITELTEQPVERPRDAGLERSEGPQRSLGRPRPPSSSARQRSSQRQRGGHRRHRSRSRRGSSPQDGVLNFCRFALS